MEVKRVKIIEEEYKLPLKNKKGEIVAWTLVDQNIAEIYKNIRLSFSCRIYAGTTNGLFHRMLTKAKTGEIVDHINGNPLDNRLANLRLVTVVENSRNRLKAKNKTSNYYGVSWATTDQTWRSSIKVNGKTINYRFDDELHAAYFRDVLIEKYNLVGSKLNNVEKPHNFIEPIRTRNMGNNGIRMSKAGHFEATITFDKKIYYLGTFDTKEDANLSINNKRKELEDLKEQQRLSEPIKRNIDGIAIIELFDKNNVRIGETLVSDNQYYNISKYKWYLNGDGYPASRINNKHFIISRFIMQAGYGQIIDHINHNRLDNRTENLRIVTAKFNAHNRTKKRNTSSKYIGVCRSHGKWQAGMSIDKKFFYIGTFSDEIEAAKTYNKKAVELYGPTANINIF